MKSEIVVCPPAPILAYLRDSYAGRRIAFGAQHISISGLGANTGEDAGELVRAAGATYTIVGHAERRAEGEDDERVAKEARAALDSGLTPIICVGEEERDKDGHYFAKIEKTLAGSVSRILPHEIGRVVIAYEPVWAIGAPLAPGARVVAEATLYVRKTLASLYGREAALKTRIIYGGAVDETTAGELKKDGQVNGFLIGRASVDALKFPLIVRACES